MLPEMHDVDSSNLKAVGYDKANSSLFVEFKREKGGQVYRYSSVPHHVYQELIEAESVGTYFATNIRNKPEFPAEKVVKPEEHEPPKSL